MALILEIVRANGERSWHRLGEGTLTLGRAYANDIIVDDPFVDAHHARIRFTSSGEVVLEDLGSVNGVRSGRTRLPASIPMHSGFEAQVGRTMLRFHDLDDPVPPALRDEDQAPPSPPVREARIAVASTVSDDPLTNRRIVRWGTILLPFATIGVFALYSWLGTTERSSASDAFAAAIGFTVLASLWAGLWALAGRIVVHRLNFKTHLAIAATATLVALGIATVSDWSAFLFPRGLVFPAIVTVLSLGLLASVLASHLEYSSHLSARHRWRFGAAVALGVLGLGLLSTLIDDEKFSDVPTFSNTLKPLSSTIIPAQGIDEYRRVMVEAKKEVDEAVVKEAANRGAP